jgi:hypothetical protein
MLRASLGFLAATQEPEGSFSETRIKLAHSPQPRFNACASVDRFFFTDAVPSRLPPLGCSQYQIVTSASPAQVAACGSIPPAS